MTEAPSPIAAVVVFEKTPTTSGMPTAPDPAASAAEIVETSESSCADTTTLPSAVTTALAPIDASVVKRATSTPAETLPPKEPPTPAAAEMPNDEKVASASTITWRPVVIFVPAPTRAATVRSSAATLAPSPTPPVLPPPSAPATPVRVIDPRARTATSAVETIPSRDGEIPPDAGCQPATARTTSLAEVTLTAPAIAAEPPTEPAAATTIIDTSEAASIATP